MEDILKSINVFRNVSYRQGNLKSIFSWLQISQKSKEIILRLSALAFKMGQIKKIRHTLLY